MVEKNTTGTTNCPIKANLRQSSGNRRPGQRQNNNNNSPSNNPKATVPKAIDTDESTPPSSGGDCGTLMPSQSIPRQTCASQSSRGNFDIFLHIDVKLDGIPTKAYVDSGSTISVASEQTLQRLNTQLIPNTAIRVNQLSGQTKTIGCFQTQLQIANRIKTIKFHVISDFQYPLLLGLDVGQQFGLQLDLINCKVSVASNPTDNEYFALNTQTVETNANTGPTMVNTQSTPTVPCIAKRKRSRAQKQQPIPQPQQQTAPAPATVCGAQTVCHHLKADEKLNKCPPEAKQVEARSRQSSDDRPQHSHRQTQPVSQKLTHTQQNFISKFKISPILVMIVIFIHLQQTTSFTEAIASKGSGHSKSHQVPEFLVCAPRSDVHHKHSNTFGKYCPNRISIYFAINLIKQKNSFHDSQNRLNQLHTDSLPIANVDKGPGHSKSHQNPEHSAQAFKSDVTPSHSNTSCKFQPNIQSNHSLSYPPDSLMSIVLFPPNKTLNAGEM